jgi:2-C-methyl-D-erythritol 2,4-cyclodiphosphate synthase
VSDWAGPEGRTLRVGLGHDTHRLVKGRPLILGGVLIDFEWGLAGHSDADVVLHAVADALLGAAALGDIGEHFPDTDPRWEGVDSAHLLAEVLDRVTQAGWRPINCDLTVHAQRPKLSIHKPAMRDRVAALLGLPTNAVNVKAKTGEHVGPVGRGEAICCDAIVLARSVQGSDSSGSPLG